MTRASKPTRRQVLRGAGGFTLALPFLSSLLPRGAQGRGLGSTPPRFVAITTDHGGVWPSNMHQADNTVTETMQYGGHEIRRGELIRSVEGGIASLSNVIRGSEDRLTADLVAKMNIVRGLDIPFYIGHNRGGHLGNWAANNGDGSDGVTAQGLGTPTIDQQLAYSDSFYGDLSTTLERTMVVGDGLGRSYGWTNQNAQDEVQPLACEQSSLALFDRIFVAEQPEEVDPRPLVADRVIENYRSLRQSNARLSAADRNRLDDHIERIDELQRRLAVAVSCGEVPIPRQDSAPFLDAQGFGTSPAMQAEYWQLFNDVIVVAFLCGTSRIAVLNVVSQFTDYALDWHQNIVHQSNQPGGEQQAALAAASQAAFENVVLDLIAKLDVDEGDGNTLLDNTLLQWTQESGPMTHESVDSCIVTAGGASGCLRTGQYLDYRNEALTHEEEYFQGTGEILRPGLLHQQYLASVMQTLGMSPSEYETVPGSGYPELFMGEGRQVLYSNETLDVRGEVLPWLQT